MMKPYIFNYTRDKWSRCDEVIRKYQLQRDEESLILSWQYSVDE